LGQNISLLKATSIIVATMGKLSQEIRTIRDISPNCNPHQAFISRILEIKLCYC